MYVCGGLQLYRADGGYHYVGAVVVNQLHYIVWLFLFGAQQTRQVNHDNAAPDVRQQACFAMHWFVLVGFGNVRLRHSRKTNKQNSENACFHYPLVVAP